jgi:hypothetical protein
VCINFSSNLTTFPQHTKKSSFPSNFFSTLKKKNFFLGGAVFENIIIYEASGKVRKRMRVRFSFFILFSHSLIPKERKKKIQNSNSKGVRMMKKEEEEIEVKK